jgi:two-component system, OmpR family, sensor histidine kinase TctE
MAAALPDPGRRSRLPGFLRTLIDTVEELPREPERERRIHATPADGSGTNERVWPVRWRRRTQAPLRRQVEQRSLFGEILDWMFAPLLLLWPLSVAVTFVVARSLADAPYDRALAERTEALAQQVSVNRQQQVSLMMPSATRDLLTQDETDQVYFQVIGPRGKLLAGESDLPGPRIYDYPEPGRVKIRTEIFRGDEVRVGYLHLPVTVDGLDSVEDRSQVLVQMAETLDKRNRLANEIIKGVIFPQFLILPVAVMLVWFGLSRGLAPLQLLQRHIRGRRPDDLSPIDPQAAPEEIAPLVDSFNDLLLRLRHNIDGQKRFIADAAHQMKTPLAGLRTQSELALRETNPDEQRRTMEQLAVGSQRAANLISQLLALARTENLRQSVKLEPLDLNALCREVVGDWVPAALQRGLDLGLEADEHPAMLDAQPILLRELLNNLIDNALRYTPTGGAVTVRVGRGQRVIWLEVEDSGPGVPEIERELVFERFHRVLGTEVDGSGLGLAIVREIAEQHGASVWVEAASPGLMPPGARFVLEFPVRRAVVGSR